MFMDFYIIRTIDVYKRQVKGYNSIEELKEALEND